MYLRAEAGPARLSELELQLLRIVARRMTSDRQQQAAGAPSAPNPFVLAGHLSPSAVKQCMKFNWQF